MKQLHQISARNNCTLLFSKTDHTHTHTKKNRANKKCTHFHKTCSYLFHMLAMYFSHVFENGKIMSKDSSLDLSTSCDFELLVKQCYGIYELIHLLCAVPSWKKQPNIYLPQVPHKAARKRVFETRFLYIEEKKKETVSTIIKKISWVLEQQSLL